MLAFVMRCFWARAIGGALLLGTLLSSTAVFAQTADELAAARRMFADAFQDEEHARYEVALEKFRRVQAIKDTSTVRFRIGVCLDALGRLEEAIVEYDAAVARADTTQRDISSSAAQRAASARLRIPQLTVELAEPQIESVVRLDNQELAPARVGVAQKVNPGRHSIDADAPGRPHFHAEVELREASSAHVRVSFGLIPSAGSSQATAPSAPLTSESPQGSTSLRTAGWITLLSGAVVATTGVVVLLVRHGQISSIEERCPGQICAAADRDFISGKQSTARTLGPLGVTFVVAGGVGALVGAGLLSAFFANGAQSTAFVSPTRGGVEAGWTGRF